MGDLVEDNLYLQYLKQKIILSPLAHFVRLEKKKRAINYPDFIDTFLKISYNRFFITLENVLQVRAIGMDFSVS